MRASGMTLAKAAEELGIAYITAVNWERALKERIETQKVIRIEDLQGKAHRVVWRKAFGH